MAFGCAGSWAGGGMFALQTFLMAPVATRHTASQPMQGRGRCSTAPSLRKSALPMRKGGREQARSVKTRVAMKLSATPRRASARSRRTHRGTPTTCPIQKLMPLTLEELQDIQGECASGAAVKECRCNESTRSIRTSDAVPLFARLPLMSSVLFSCFACVCVCVLSLSSLVTASLACTDSGCHGR